MPIRRNSGQKSKSLEEFYLELTQEGCEPQTIKIGNAMLSFIVMINRTFKSTQIWGLTSLYSLVIQADDDWKSPWYIVVRCIGTEEYYFEYQLPPNKGPWENAKIIGVARSIDEAQKVFGNRHE